MYGCKSTVDYTGAWDQLKQKLKMYGCKSTVDYTGAWDQLKQKLKTWQHHSVINESSNNILNCISRSNLATAVIHKSTTMLQSPHYHILAICHNESYEYDLPNRGFA